MASVAEKKRRRKQAISLGRAPAKADAAPARPKARSQGYVRRMSGLECLAGRGKVDGRQRFALERYGRLYRIAGIEDGAALKSSLADLDGVRGAGGGLPTLENYADVITRCREALAGARAELSFQTGLIIACDLVCGRTMTTNEITDVRTEVVELETSLRLAGDLLARHFEAAGWPLS